MSVHIIIFVQILLDIFLIVVFCALFFGQKPDHSEELLGMIGKKNKSTSFCNFCDGRHGCHCDVVVKIVASEL